MSEEIRNQINPRMFYIIRYGDESGVSGVGRVLDGILWANGWCSIMWRTDLDPMKRGMSSITFFDSFNAFMDIHINSHPDNNTEVVWVDDEVVELRKENDDIKEKFSTKSKRLKEANKEIREMKDAPAEQSEPVAEANDPKRLWDKE